MTTNSAPFTVQPRLTQISMAVKPTGMIADLVCPRVDVMGEKFTFTKYITEESFTIPDTKVGRTSEPNSVEFGGVDVEDATEDHGLSDWVPQKDIDNARASGSPIDPLAVATERTTLLIELAREKRVSDLYFALATYAAALRTTLAGNSQWSDYANSDPVTAILTAFDGMLIRPNVAVLGRAVWTKLRMHPKVVAAVLNSGNGQGGEKSSGVVGRRAVADLLELDEIYVGESFYNTAKKGQAAAMARLWGKHASFLRIDKSVKSPTGGMPTFAMTGQWQDRKTKTFFDPRKGVDGSHCVLVAEHVKELVTFQDAGYHFHDAVA